MCASLQHRSLARQHWLFAFWLLWIHTTTPSPKDWRPSLWDLWFWSLDCLWDLILAMLSILPETSDHVFSQPWLGGAVKFSRKCTDFEAFSLFLLCNTLIVHTIYWHCKVKNFFLFVTPQGEEGLVPGASFCPIPWHYHRCDDLPADGWLPHGGRSTWPEEGRRGECPTHQYHLQRQTQRHFQRDALSALESYTLLHMHIL